MAGAEISAELAAGLTFAGAERHTAEMGAHTHRDQPVLLAFLGALGKRLRVAQVAVVVQITLGAALLLDGRESPDSLHYLYGLLPIVVTLLAEGARAVATEHEVEGLDFESLPKERQRAVAVAITRRETGIMAVSALVIFGLALRAYFTSPLG